MPTVSIRDTERQQLLEYLPDIVSVYEETDLEDVEERTAPIKQLQTALETGQTELDLDRETWSEITVGLRQLHWVRSEEYSKNRIGWLRAKIARRADLSGVQMSYTSNPPIMQYASGQEPQHPEYS
jgi:hypothetical protein